MSRLFSGLLALVIVCWAHVASASYFQQFVHYTLNVRLDTEGKRISGDEVIVYTNNSPDELTEFFIHLYPNAYQSRHTPFMLDYRRRFNINLFDVPKSNRGDLNVSEVTVDGTPVDVTTDCTIARFDLPRPLAPGATMEIRLKLDGKVRKHLGRAGYKGEHYDFAQWYPKVVVYDENGFHPDPFRIGEFYGEFGTFDVHLDVPGNSVVAATGVLVDGDPGWDYNPAPGETATVAPDAGQRKTVYFHAEKVHDFAWCVDPSFVVQDTTFNGVDIYSFYRKSNARAWQDSVLVHGVRSIEWLEQKVGKYAYPQISIVDALLGGGMEYPMLVMDGKPRETLAVHEIGHVYFYGILANDERAEAWLDEGFTTFQTRWYEESRYGADGNRSEQNWYQRITPHPDLWEQFRSDVFYLQRRHYGERVSTRAEDFEHSYYTHVYRKAALTLNALRYVVGEDTLERILQEYYSRWQLRHVNEERFITVAEEVSGQDLGLFFEQWLHTTKQCDYRLAEVRSEKGDESRVTVTVKRLGEMIMPLELVFTMPDGSVERRRLDGRLRTIKATFDLPARPRRTALNPANEIADINMNDNFVPRRRDFQFDWPNNYYAPEWGYQIRYRPAAWYNIVDGLKTGLYLRGSHHDWSRRIKLGLYYGVESDRMDFDVSYDKPFRFFDRNSRLYLYGAKMEGRESVGIAISMTGRARNSVPPSHDIVFGYSYNELTNPRYLPSTEMYDTSRADVGLFASYTVDPEIDILSVNFNTTVRLGREWTGGEMRYEKLRLSLSLKTRTEFIPVDARIRLFAGLLGGDAPLQQKFNLAGGGALERDQRFWLRSPDAVPEDLHYHEPGDGNLRGYNHGSFVVNKLLATNVEFGTRLPLFYLSKLFKYFPGPINWYGFYDVGAILDSQNPVSASTRIQGLVDGGILNATLSDAGIGFRSRAPLPFWDLRLRFDMPFYVSNPEVNGESDTTRMRYVFGLSSTF